MHHALAMGARGLGQVWPNPSVGCVIVKDGRVVGRGVTQSSGRPHAEIVALAHAGAEAAGATVYVTLEPCSHFGKTAPCSASLISAKVSRVVAALEDPDPRVSGGGFAQLREAGIEVKTGVLAQEARAQHIGFLNRIRLGRPMVTLKLASSFDGRIATASGDSKWITGPLARRQVHAMRAQFDAILVGAGTARQDDPSLTVRDLGPMPQPVRVVISRKLNLQRDGALARTARETPLWLVHGPGCEPERIEDWNTLGAKLIECPAQGHHVDCVAMLQALGAKGLTRLYCEGGGSLAASLLSLGLVDELHGFTAGMMIGAEGQPSLGTLGLSLLSEAPRFHLVDYQAFGPDLLHIWHRVPSL